MGGPKPPIHLPSRSLSELGARKSELRGLGTRTLGPSLGSLASSIHVSLN